MPRLRIAHNSLRIGHASRLWLLLPIATALAAAGLLLGVVQTVRADMAPFPAQEGNSIGPAAPTTVQMISETVLIQVVEMSRTFGDTSYPFPGAKVTADFLLRNSGGADEVLQVGFPMQVPKQAASAGDYVKITNLAASAGGSAFETEAATVGGEIWSAWQMRFPPGDTTVRITYDLPVTSDRCNAELGYIIHTGAAWAGPIGQADLIVRYPYAAEAGFLSPRGYYLNDPTAGYKVEGTDLHWHYDNLEPTAANDLAVTFVSPECWLKVAAARSAVNQTASAENYLQLANAYGDIVSYSHSFYSPLIAQVADAQFQKALGLDPKNPDINTAYAEFLVYHVGYLLPASRQPDEIQQCVQALQLAPQDDSLSSLCGSFLASVGVDPEATQLAAAATAATDVPQPTLSLNATVTPLLSATLAATAQPTASPAPSMTPTDLRPPTQTIASTQVAQVLPSPLPTALVTPATPPATGQPWVPLGITIAAILVIAGGVFVWRRRGS